MYYASARPAGYVTPGYIVFDDVAVQKFGTKVYLIAALHGEGDVWQVKVGDTLAITQNSISGTSNANLDALNPQHAAGPFYGDQMTFNSALSSNNTVAVNWTFGDSNPPAGQQPSSNTGATITHRFGGEPTGSAAITNDLDNGGTSATGLPATYNVVATNSNDASISDTLAVPLKKPQARYSAYANGSAVDLGWPSPRTS